MDLADLKGDSPLHYASAWGHLKVIQLLIERGAAFQNKASSFHRMYTAWHQHHRRTIKAGPLQTMRSV